MKLQNSGPTRPNMPKKPGYLNLNLLVFTIVGLAFTVLTYQIGHEVANQLTLNSSVSQQSEPAQDILVVNETPGPVPGTPSPNPGSVPLPADSPAAPVPSSNRPRTVANPAPTATVPPPVKTGTTAGVVSKTGKPAAPATARNQVTKAAPKPTPTTKPS